MDENDEFNVAEDIEVIYSDGEDEDEGDAIENMLDEFTIEENEDEIETEIIDESIITFSKHSKSVFCSDLGKDDQLAITGGEDDIAYLWNTSSAEVVLECTGHKDSVTDVAFNYDNQYLATADMSGMIQVWSVEQKKLVWCFEGDDMEWMSWHHKANVLFSGYEDGLLRLWNIKETHSEWSNTQNETITSIDINGDGTLGIVAPGAMMFKMSDGKIISTLLASGEKEIESGLFDNKLGIVATGSISGHLCVWDISKQILRHQAKIECAVTILKWGKDEKVFVGGSDGAIYVCDAKNGTLQRTLTGHRADILSISVFNDDTKILTTSDDGTAKIFKII
ncbi:hypothetical protein NQ317_004700 [Molorchus minor]|uniref:Angio-associated migratory cell protein n=1 Tax=Molorchus minor TaxID=1323400 RepID=A0ABQ9J2E8_9CUCU|nr:hypothetical protein NQ317_004700 [Molorchus minor]